MTIKLLGVGLLEISDSELNDDINILFHRGMDRPLMQNIIESCKSEIYHKKEGNSVIALDDFTIFIYYFQNPRGHMSVLIFLDEGYSSMNYVKFHRIIKEIKSKVFEQAAISEIKKILEDSIDFPRAEGLNAIFILGTSGSAFVSKVKRGKVQMDDVCIAGFISAIHSFSKLIMGEDSGAELKEIVFGNQVFYLIVNYGIIFAYLVDDVSLILKRFMHLLADEFLEKHYEDVKKFKGDLSPFIGFENVIEQYFVI